MVPGSISTGCFVPRFFSKAINATVLHPSTFPFWANLLRLSFRLPVHTTVKLFLYNKIFLRFFAWRRLSLRATLKNGIKLGAMLPDLVQSHLFCFGAWEPVLTKYVTTHLSEGDIFVDIGANVGYFSFIASPLVGAKGKVYSFEASPSICRQLTSNARANGVSNIDIRQVAVSNVQGVIELWKDVSGNEGNSTVTIQMATLASHSLEAAVPCDRLGSLMNVNAIENAKMIKIDVEGHEVEVLEGMSRHFPKMKGDIIFEWTGALHTSKESRVEALLRQFDVAGYRLFAINNNLDVRQYFDRENTLEKLAFDAYATFQQDVIATKN
jgi:FkbM family methyltransferase